MNREEEMMTRVLLVDDDKNFLQSVGHYLTTKGIESIPAKDGMEALRKLDEVDPEVILLDVLLPKVGGLEVCRRIRETGGTVPIILTSGVYKKSEIQNEAVSKFGANNFLVKPIEPEVLVKMIENLSGKGSKASSKKHGRSRKPSIDREDSGNQTLESVPAAPSPPKGDGHAVLQKSSPSPNLEGDIHKDTIAALLLHLHRGRSSGVLEVLSGKEKRMIFLLDGRPVFASSFSFTEQYTVESVLRIIRECVNLDKGTYYFGEGLEFLDYVPTYDLPLPFH